ncbi:uncharacterized protein LOC114292990 isoform X2 [Camellia sinensis]|uniref:uncharacterized protein LOC114292990 isoform X2 n=1 Tax=Camellia sinensis TaxID=4442 RepID=UPI0010355111|nr:uncharacterized protein LOC114292990 isoform X2 [Camellia sinensis]
MWVLQGAVKMVWSLPEVMRVACTFMLVMLLWLALWSFGAAGVVASSMRDGGRWWLLVIRGFRSKIGNSVCCCAVLIFLFYLVETLVRFFNKYAYVQVIPLSFYWLRALFLLLRMDKTPGV